MVPLLNQLAPLSKLEKGALGATHQAMSAFVNKRKQEDLVFAMEQLQQEPNDELKAKWQKRVNKLKLRMLNSDSD